MTRVPAFAVVGVPNAGKSTLINRLTGTRVTVVHETPGVTRDRKVIETEWAGRVFKLIDTGGYDTSDQSVLGGDIRSQIKVAVGEADAALFVVDGRVGPLPGDYEIADVLRCAKIPTVLVANKVDDPRHEAGLVALAGRLAGEAATSDDSGGHDERTAEIAVAILDNGQPTALIYSTRKGWRYGVEGRASLRRCHAVSGKEDGMMNGPNTLQLQVDADDAGVPRRCIASTPQPSRPAASAGRRKSPRRACCSPARQRPRVRATS